MRQVSLATRIVQRALILPVTACIPEQHVFRDLGLTEQDSAAKA